MRRDRLLLTGAALSLSLAIAGCATGANVADAPPPEPIESSATPTADPAALAQAEGWLDAATLPAGAVREDGPTGSFTSYTGWPCGPYEELEGFWTVPGMTVIDAANWLIENPTPGLVTTAFAPVTDEWGPVDSAIVGYIPEPNAQEGIVYTVANAPDGVVIRAEVAAQTDAAICPPLPDGGVYGPPGMG